MYVFGGKDLNNKKLNDFWKFDFELLKWTELSIRGGPSHRSGHSSSVYEDFLIIYGGIYDVTRELNDMHIYSFKSESWICLFSQIASPLPKSRESFRTGSPGRSPDKRFELSTKLMMELHDTNFTGKKPFLSIRPTD